MLKTSLRNVCFGRSKNNSLEAPGSNPACFTFCDWEDIKGVQKKKVPFYFGLKCDTTLSAYISKTKALTLWYYKIKITEDLKCFPKFNPK